MQKFNLIIKPTSECNLRCKYCYHKTTEYECGIIDKNRVIKLMDISAQVYKNINIIWHGGEPLVCGMKFYEEILSEQTKIGRKYGCRFTNSIQTNATMIDKKWVKFFRKYRIGVGISYDGHTHDELRMESAKVHDAFSLLNKYHLNPGCLAVVSNYNKDLIKLYEDCKKYSNHLKMNQVFDEDGSASYLVDTNEYINQVITFFDYYMYDQTGIKVEPFASYIFKSLGVLSGMCSTTSCLGKWLDMDAKGNLRVCGQTSNKDFIIGHIDNVSSLREIFNSESFNNLLIKSMERRSICKQTCPFFKQCQGGCIFRNIIDGGYKKINGNTCFIFKSVYQHISKTIKQYLLDKKPLADLNPVVKNIILECTSQSTFDKDKILKVE